MNKLSVLAITLTMSATTLANAATKIDAKVLASGTWDCTINGNSQQWAFNEKNGFTMNGESGKYKISGSNMNLEMGAQVGTVAVTKLSKDALVFEDSDGITSCKKSKTNAATQKNNSGFGERGRTINFVPF